jgi:hypothetical protein
MCLFRLSCIVLIMLSSSCRSKERNVVSNRQEKPFCVACFTRIGSNTVCGISTLQQSIKYSISTSKFVTYMLARTGRIVVALENSQLARVMLNNFREIWALLTILPGSFPQEYIRPNSSPVILLHHRVCNIHSPFTASL